MLLLPAFLLAASWWSGATALGQEGAAAPPSGAIVDALTSEFVADKIKAIEADTELDEALRTRLLESYRLAATQLTAATTEQSRLAALKQQLETAPKRLADMQAELAATPPVAAPEVGVSPETTTDELSRQLTQEQTDSAGLKSRLATVETALKELAARPAKAREEMAAARQRLEQIVRDLETPPPADEPASITAARGAALEARQQARTAQVVALEQELLSQDTRLALATAERDLLTRKVANADVRLTALQDALNRRKLAEADAARVAAEQAQREAVGKDPAVRALADQNAELSRELTDIVESAQDRAKQREKVTQQLQQLEQQFEDAKKKLDVAGLSETLGHILRDQRTRLRRVNRFEQTTAERSHRLSQVGLDQIRIDELRRESADVELAVKERLEGLDRGLSETQRAVIEEELRKLLAARKELLDTLGPAYAGLVRELGELDFEQKQLADEAEQYAQFLDERLLWIPSAPAISLSTADRLDDDLTWLFIPSAWTELSATLYAQYTSRPIMPSLVLILFVTLLALRRRMRRKCDAMAECVGKVRVDGFRLTFLALVSVLLDALPWPLLLGCAGWMLREDRQASSFPSGFGHGLLIAAVLLYPILALAGLCGKRGLAEVHLGWSAHAIAVMRRNLLWLRMVAPPLAFLITFTAWQSDVSHEAGLGRLAFIAVMIAFTFFVTRVLHPRTGAVAPALQRRPEGLVAQLRFGWYAASIATPLALAGLAAAGYYYTAQQLVIRLLAAVSIIVIAIITHDLVMRALALARTKLAIKQAQERRAAQAAARKAEAEGGIDASVTMEPPAIDIAAVNEQTRHFVRGVIGVSLIAALWAVWADVLPALAIFDGIELWHQNVVVDGETRLVPITLRDVGLTALLGFLTVVAARNLPGAMDMMVLGRLPIDAGTRYAVSSISRYAIIVLGVIFAFNMVGIGWPEVQWLLAALTVGLGFGLQEIFANFVSGLIILVERPIRVGDTVTVGGVSGIVTRLQIRATTITDWNRKELIVPNKRFITEDVINWTLSDPLTRLDVPVGIAYGSDTTLALRLMHDAAAGVLGVLESPEPEVFFVGFGDNALNFEVRVYARELTNKGRTKVVHGVHLAVDEVFREHDVVIAFPQRDLHLKSSDVPITLVTQLPDGTIQPIGAAPAPGERGDGTRGTSKASAKAIAMPPVEPVEPRERPKP